MPKQEGELEILEAYGWAAQALAVATAAEEVGVEVEVWAAARVKPAARARVVSCMVYSRKKPLQLAWNERIEYERNNICSKKRTFAVSMRGRKPGELNGDKL